MIVRAIEKYTMRCKESRKPSNWIRCDDAPETEFNSNLHDYDFAFLK